MLMITMNSLEVMLPRIFHQDQEVNWNFPSFWTLDETTFWEFHFDSKMEQIKLFQWKEKEALIQLQNTSEKLLRRFLNSSHNNSFWVFSLLIQFEFSHFFFDFLHFFFFWNFEWMTTKLRNTEMKQMRKWNERMMITPLISFIHSTI